MIPALLYGQNPDGRLVSIDEAKRGIACELVCPECGRRLVARKADIKQHHFAHESGFACEGAVETALHKLAKQIIADARGVHLPPLVVQTDFGKKLLSSSRWIHFERVELEVWMDGMRPDIVGYCQGRPLAIEIMVTHACEPEKIALLESRQIAAIEIDVSGLRHDTNGWPAGVLRSAPRQWIFNRFVNQETARINAEREVALAAQRAREITERETQITGMLKDMRLPESFDWQQYKLQGTPSPFTLAQRGGSEFRHFAEALEALRAWVLTSRLPIGPRPHPTSEELLGLPLEGLLAERLAEDERRRAEATAENERRAKERAEQRQREEEARRKREAERAAAEEAARQKRWDDAAGYRKDITEAAQRSLGEGAASQWLEGRAQDGSKPLDALSKEQMDFHWDRLEQASKGKRRQAQAHAGIRDKLLTAATRKLGSLDRAILWMRSKHPKLGMRMPNDVCVEDGGYDRCVGVLK